MKKYLMTGIAALAMCFGFTSCSHDIEPASQEDLDNLEAQKIVNDYNQAFIKTFGQPAANQDWGFGTTRAFTRGDSDCGQCYKFDMKYDTPSFPKTGNPPAITDSERAYVKNWFETNPGLSEVGLDIHNFYIQHVWGQANKNYNVDYSKGDYVAQATMDYCEVGDGTNYTHILDFNSNSGGNFGIVYMRNSSALSFGVHATWGDNRDYHNFKLAHIVGTAADGTKIDGWYVGLAMYGQKDDNGIRTLNKDQMTYADDWILKIVPGEGEEIPSDIDVRIIAEDLNATAQMGDTENSDWDFNDVVFDVKFITDDKAEITLVAAGGTLPLIVGVENPENGVAYPDNEVHKLFGVDVDCMVNTNAPSKGLKGVDNKTASNKITFEKTGVKSSNGKDIPIFVEKTLSSGAKRWFELKAQKGQPAAKLAVNSKKFEYCEERQDITTKYTNFKNWVVDNNPLIWWE